MRVKLRLTLLLLSLLCSMSLLAAWTFATRAEESSALSLSLPRRIGPWTATVDEALPPDARAMVDPDAYLLRRYDAPARSPIWIYVAVYGARAGYGKGAHSPEVCYPAQGWEVLDSRPIEVPVTESELFPARLMTAHHSHRKEAVIYWFQPAGRWAAATATEQLLRLHDALMGRPQYAFVRLSGPGDRLSGAVRDLRQFAGAVAPSIRAELERLD